MEKAELSLIVVYLFYILGIGLYMFSRRFHAVKTKQVRGSYFKAYQGEVPNDLKVIGNHFNNQFQLPLIFFMACIASVVMHRVTPLFFTLSCTFLISRLLHSYFHLGSNHLLLRAFSYFLGFPILIAMWILLILSL